MASFLQTSTLYPHQFIESLIVTWHDIEKNHQPPQYKTDDHIKKNLDIKSEPKDLSNLPKPFHDSLVHVFRFGHNRGLW